MSGHSKWAKIKRKKSIGDQQRGKLFSKLIKEITVAARNGGGNPDLNARLRQVIDKGKEANMPADNIKRAIQKGIGELEGASYEEITYEGYGPGGIAILVRTLTDNKKRTAADVRSIFSKFGGNMGDTGCVGWLFQKKGVILVDKKNIDEEKMFSIALDAGAEDVKTEENTYEVQTTAEKFEEVKANLQKNNVTINSAEISLVPSTVVPLKEKEAEHCLHLVEAFEEHDDVQDVYANFDIPDSLLEALQED